jgi:hypothetical protein
MHQNENEIAIKNRLDHVYWSFYMYNGALNEYSIISDREYNQSELKIVNSHTFDFYRITLQYCYLMEYNKLFEKGRNDLSQNISSLNQLNVVIHKFIGQEFSTKFSENESSLSLIRESNYYDRMRKLRDKKFAHADKHDMNRAFNITGLTSDEIGMGFEHLEIASVILNKCTSVFNFEYDTFNPKLEDRTFNFVKFHAEYQDYYFKNYFDAISGRSNNKKL